MSEPFPELKDFPRQFLSAVLIGLLQAGVPRDQVINAAWAGDAPVPVTLAGKLYAAAIVALVKAGYSLDYVTSELQWLQERIDAMADHTLEALQRAERELGAFQGRRPV